MTDAVEKPDRPVPEKTRHLSHQSLLSFLHKIKHGVVTRRDPYSQFPRSPLGTPGIMKPFWRTRTKKK